jgi:RNA polymerase sigma-70 factor (ECF subfamily)
VNSKAKAMTEVDWTSFETRLRAYVRGRIDPLWVDDVVGDILLRLVQHRDSLHAADSPLALVLRVATNAVTDHYRRRSVENRALGELGNENTNAAEFEEAVDDGDDSELASCVLPFIHALPEKYREALLLTDIGGLTQMDAAKRLGISNSGMKSRVQRGRARVKQALLNCCAIEFDRRGGVMDYSPLTTGCGQDC